MVKIHGLPFSTCTTRVLACCHEKEVEYEVIPVNLMAGAHKQKPHLDLNPFGQIPALQDGDLTLFESRAITRYLSKQQQGTDLLGGTVAEQAMVDVWCEVEAQQYNPPCSAVVQQIVIIPAKGGKTDEEVVKINLEKLSKVLDVYEERLAKHNYLAGDFFSLADLHHLPYTHYLVHAARKGELITSRPHVSAWWERISTRPAWQKVSQNMKR
ncbi:glutathione S-transferase F13 [Cryptomeria japonica]|uniref:glutathione S-transferase F13 n=1 Tax=Cryptomeria japonica TaxID=3369 RepID=UPI0025ACD95E|nr:glutathione S-transferase F13 [Cryptomeria japonica]